MNGKHFVVYDLYSGRKSNGGNPWQNQKQLEKHSYKQQTFFRPGNLPPQRYKIMKLNCIYIRLTCMIYVSNIQPTNFFNSSKESHCLLILFKSKVPSFLVQHLLLSSQRNWTKLDIRRIDMFSDPILCPFYKWLDYFLLLLFRVFSPWHASCLCGYLLISLSLLHMNLCDV